MDGLSPKCPPHFRTEAHKIRYLRSAVIGISRAKQPISDIGTSKYTFTSLITALKERLQLEEEIKNANKSLDIRLVEEETIYNRYARDPKLVKKYSPRNNGAEPRRFFPSCLVVFPPPAEALKKAAAVPSVLNAGPFGSQDIDVAPWQLGRTSVNV